jgi:hypothetical protein
MRSCQVTFHSFIFNRPIKVIGKNILTDLTTALWSVCLLLIWMVVTDWSVENIIPWHYYIMNIIPYHQKKRRSKHLPNNRLWGKFTKLYPCPKLDQLVYFQETKLFNWTNFPPTSFKEIFTVARNITGYISSRDW